MQMCCGKTLSICISRVANEQNLGDPYQPYQPAIKTLHERIASLAAGSILTSVTWILLELPLEGHTEEKSLEHLSSDHLSLASKGPTCPNQGYWYHPFFIVLVFFFNLYFLIFSHISSSTFAEPAFSRTEYKTTINYKCAHP